MPRRVRMMLLLCVTALLAACNEDPAAPRERAADIEARLFKAMNEDDFAAAGDIVGELYMMRDEDPLNYRNTFLLGGAAFWWLAEAGRPEANGLQIISQSIPIILESFIDVIQNDEVNRPGASALLGAFLSDGGFDRVQGNKLVEQSVALAPEVGLFQRMHIRRFAFADDSATVNAIEAGYQWWEYCVGGPVNRTNPDFTGKVQAPTEDHHKKFCWGSARVPHGYEGAWLIFGDLLVKAGRMQEARTAYQNAKLGPNYTRWKYKDVLEQRLTGNLEQRRTSYTNRDANQWASIGLPPYSCTQCHASAR